MSECINGETRWQVESIAYVVANVCDATDTWFVLRNGATEKVSVTDEPIPD